MKLAVIARWKPVHLVHAALLEALGRLGDPLLVGVGSANRRDLRNPFSYEETAAMLAPVLAPFGDRVQVVPVPDLGDGPRWAAMVRERFGPLDLFVSANPWVRQLMTGIYPLAHPRELVPVERHLPLDGSEVRRALARGEGWRPLVPPAVAEVMDRLGLPERFRREFGLATLALELAPPARGDAEEEERHVLLGR